jgi:hypothetical protein
MTEHCGEQGGQPEQPSVRFLFSKCSKRLETFRFASPAHNDTNETPPPGWLKSHI